MQKKLTRQKQDCTIQQDYNLDIVLSCLNILDGNRYNIYIQFSIQYQDYSDKDVKNLILS